MRTAGCYPSQGNDVWVLANATVYEAREVAANFNDHAARVFEVLKAIQFAFIVATAVMPALRRLATKQSRLIAKLETAPREKWDPESCREMSLLLHDLIKDEGNFIENGWDYMRPCRPLIAGHLDTLRAQLRRLNECAINLDALSVPEKPMPGDSDCQEFMAMLAGPEEYDFAEEPGSRRKIHSHA
jgi:hypothetical protein